ncbi:MAG: 6-phosphogluconolactonase [Rhodospirillaceae bacterium]|nr:6-phosphogluconolactonase [Rhodospirillaceae bacterium]MBT5244524.1 6-phosphogluconolactonase [Rhodospirillaceae bacterium]MBT6241620.1 6-phosphogluconolactonase [Rhodospirillaceae bacterium]MBT7138416.1 6-phosphogluconolactonase [Rhodospirillaceae bacterium]
MLLMKPCATMQNCVVQLVKDMAGYLELVINMRGNAFLAVSGGRTPEHVFPLLAKQAVAWEKVSITLADERWVDTEHPDSNERLARRLLLQGPASRARFVGLKTDHQNPLDAEADVEAALTTLNWPLDALFLGMGEDGHIASLFPDEKNWSDVPGLALAVADSEKRQPRMSLTPAALLNSHHIFVVISGPEKRAILDAAMKPGPVGDYPIRLVLHQQRVPVTIYAVD